MKIHLLLASLLTVGVRAATNEPTTVTSDRLQVDYAANFGTFEGNVLVTDPRLALRADKMIVFFAGTNVISATGITNTPRAVQRIIAEGSVLINQDKKKATSDRAEYTVADGKVVLTGNPRVESPDGIVSGKTITLWHGQQKVDVESDATETNRTRLIIFPDEKQP
jgi:lipopolysaccharide export system protein LptA